MLCRGLEKVLLWLSISFVELEVVVLTWLVVYPLVVVVVNSVSLARSLLLLGV